MVWILLGIISTLSYAAPTKLIIDRIAKMEWTGESYIITFESYEKKVEINRQNHTVPCLENAQKSNMEVLLEIDPKEPVIKTCKLYSSVAPVKLEQAIEAQKVMKP